MTNEEILRSIKYASYVKTILEQIQAVQDDSQRFRYNERVLNVLLELYPLYVKDKIPNELIDVFFLTTHEKEPLNFVTQADYNIPEMVTKACVYLIEAQDYPNRNLNRIGVAGYLNNMDSYINSYRNKTLETDFKDEIRRISEFATYYDEAEQNESAELTSEHKTTNAK
ncbi:MAG TPA: hypothetical protein VHA74_00905 [Candidatus Dojkabacteria bacterium]|nr:hypothetical protein [Candidatus Dojkabacteria bacterium]